MPGLDVVSFTTASGVANAVELTVASLANPTELNSVGVAVPDWRLCKTVGAGTDDATLYRLDASNDSVSTPYIMASVTAGLRWIAIAGRYVNQDQTTVGAIVSSGAGGVSRTDAQFEAISPGAGGHALISIFQQEAPAVSGPFEEGAISYQLKNAAGTIVQSTSLSSMWCSSAHSSTGFTMARMNVTYNGGITGEVQQRWYGNNGISLFGSDDTSAYAPGDQIFRNFGYTHGGSGTLEDGLIRAQGTGIPAAAAGSGIEIGESAGNAFVQGYNRTSSAFSPLIISGSTITLSQGEILLASASLTTGGFRVEGATVPSLATGPGLEFGYSSGGATAYFQGYNRTSSAFTPLSISGSAISFDQATTATFSSSMVVSVANTTEATNPTAAGLVTASGLGVGKRSFLGTIATTFSGNVIAAVQDGTADTAGAVGEVTQGTNQTSYTNFTTTATYQQLAALTSLARGRYRLVGTVTYYGNGATVAAITDAIFAISTTTASAAGAVEGRSLGYITQPVTSSTHITMTIDTDINISAATSYFLNGRASFTAGNPQYVASLTAYRLR